MSKLKVVDINVEYTRYQPALSIKGLNAIRFLHMIMNLDDMFWVAIAVFAQTHCDVMYSNLYLSESEIWFACYNVGLCIAMESI